MENPAASSSKLSNPTETAGNTFCNFSPVIVKMNLSLPTETKTFSLLSIGQRGVGKTVFLAGSYTELHRDQQTLRSQQLWFDTQKHQKQTTLGQLLNYITHTGQYPPPTMKVTNFHFSLKRRGLVGEQTLCNFRWWEIPGEICQLSDQDFMNMMSSSHGCCVFIDAYALAHEPLYLQELKPIIEMVTSLASLISLNQLNYAFALILTKCDLLEPGISRKALEERLQPLTVSLHKLKANYQVFYSYIPIAHKGDMALLNPQGAAAPLLWLVWELSKTHNPGLLDSLTDLVTRLLPKGTQLQQALQQLDDGSIEQLFKPWKFNHEKTRTIQKLKNLRQRLLLGFLLTIGAVGVVSAITLNMGRLFPHQPRNLEALRNVSSLEQKGQFDQAVLLMEKLAQQQPKDVELHLQLAELYQLAGQISKAEATYEDVIAQQPDNVKALVGKATLRAVQRDPTTAKALFAQAEKVAPNNNLKAQVRALAQKTLTSADK